jgi:hypothetical protein
MMSVTGRPEDPPTFCGASINDKATGMFCTVIGALAAHCGCATSRARAASSTPLCSTRRCIGWKGQVNGYLANGVTSQAPWHRRAR